MSALYVDPTNWIPLAVLLASLAGSGHCVAMCGGLVLASARTPSSWIAYHLGRLAGYMALGALAGGLGATLLKHSTEDSPGLVWLSWLAAVLIGLSFLIAGTRVWQGHAVHLPVVPASVLSWFYKRGGRSAWITGTLSALLPCGWLHSFALGAIATQSPFSGAGFLFVFWLGTLPALGLAPWLTERFFRPFSRRSPKVAGLILITAGLMSVGMKIAPLGLNHPQATGHPESCH